MNLVFSNKITAFFCSLFAAIFLLLVILWGMGNGKKNAGSEVVLANSSSIRQALNFFYQDKNRYPTALEFKDQNIMQAYLAPFPTRSVVSGSCTESFSYKRTSTVSYKLSFCIPTGTNGFKKGWNSLEQKN